MSLTELIESALGRLTLRHSSQNKLYSIESAKKTEINNHVMIIRKNNQAISLETKDTVGGQTTNHTDADFIKAYAKIIDGLHHTENTYRNTKENHIWKTLYNAQTRETAYIKNETPIKQSELTIPCMNCGLVLPTRLITIDHQRPQSGGRLEAVLKTLRVFGLTREGPKGVKGQMLMRHLRQGIQPTPLPTKPGRTASTGGNLGLRYTLNDEGILFYSFLIAVGAENTLMDRCLHGMINLSPLCQHCNSKRGNPLKFQPQHQ